MDENRGSQTLLDDTHETVVTSGNSHRPRFLQIADDIRVSIARSELNEHEGLPSERNLAEQFGVSRMTARRALEALESEGLIYSEDRRGRFVSPPRLRYNISDMVSFVADAQEKQSDLTIDVIHVGAVEADAWLSKLLEQPVGTKVYEYTRLFHSGGHAIFIETECVIADRFPDFLEQDLHQSTTRILESVYETQSRTGDIFIRMRGVHADEANLLSIATSHPVIELEQVIRDQTGTPFCFGRQVWRGELAEFSARAVVTKDVINE